MLRGIRVAWRVGTLLATTSMASSNRLTGGTTVGRAAAGKSEDSMKKPRQKEKGSKATSGIVEAWRVCWPQWTPLSNSNTLIVTTMCVPARTSIGHPDPSE